ncbi:hypothetical protein JCM11491_002871 [Sporobolomyces phaffii]
MLPSPICTTAVLVFLLGLAEARRLDVPLQRRDDGLRSRDGTVSFEALDVERLRLSRKYERIRRARNSTESLDKRGSDYSSLAYDGQALWTGPISVGTPPQTFQAFFDTGSTDLALASSTCNDPSCVGKARYDRAQSSTAKATTFQVQSTWATGSSGNGLLVRDTVTIGKTTVTSQDVVAETSIGSYISSRAADAVVGLAFRDLSAARSYAFPFTLAQQGGAPYFSLLLSRTPGQAKISFNGYDRRFIRSGPTWYQVSKDQDEQFRTLWQIGQSTAFVNNRQAWKGFSNFALDSGSPVIIAPPSAAADFWAAIPLSRKENDSYWTFPCNIPPRVAIVFNRQTSKKFDIDPRDFNLGPLPADPTRCVGAVIAQNLNLGDTWILGDSFFRSYFVVFDVSQNRIGIAVPRT